MKLFVSTIVLFAAFNLKAQNIIPITHNGAKYEVLDMTATGKVTWGGYDAVPNNAATSETSGSANTSAIVSSVGNNPNFDGKPYAAKLCKSSSNGGHNDWYLPSKTEADIVYLLKDKLGVEERGTIWTSTEANATQAVTKYWYTGANYSNQKVEEYHFVCIRKVD